MYDSIGQKLNVGDIIFYHCGTAQMKMIGIIQSIKPHSAYRGGYGYSKHVAKVHRYEREDGKPSTSSVKDYAAIIKIDPLTLQHVDESKPHYHRTLVEYAKKKAL